MQSRRNILAAGGAGLVLLPTIKLRAEGLSPKAVPPEISIYTVSPMVEDASLSPDGQHVALITKKDSSSYVLVRSLNGEKSVAFDLRDRKVRSVVWGSNNHVVISNSFFTQDIIKNINSRAEIYTTRICDIKTGTEYVLFEKVEGRPTHPLGDVYRLRSNNKYYIASSKFVDMQGLTLYTFDLDSYVPKLVAVQHPDRRHCGWLLTSDGAPLARASYYTNNQTWFLEVCVDTLWKTVFKQKEAVDYPTLVGKGRSEKSVIVAIWAGEDAGRYFEVGFDGVFSEPLNQAGANAYPLFHPVSGLFCGFAHRDDEITYDYNSPEIQKIADLCKAALPDQRVTICEFACEDPRKVLILGEGIDDPGTYYVVDFSAGTSVVVGARYPTLDVQWIAPKTPLQYKAADGLEIHGYLTLPPIGLMPDRDKARNLPLIVLPHGGPQARDTLAFDWESQLYASRGYAVLQPNFRGSTGYGRAFVEAGYGEFGRKMQTDLSDGVRYLASQGIIDPARVAIVGASYGGYAALAGATIDTGIYRCAVSIAGISNLRDFVNTSLPQRFDDASSLYWKRFFGDVKTLDQRSPRKLADKCNIPVLLIHGKEDTVVPIEQSRKMKAALKAANKNVTLIELEGEDHWQSRENRRLEMSRAVVAFLNEHNPSA